MKGMGGGAADPYWKRTASAWPRLENKIQTPDCIHRRLLENGAEHDHLKNLTIGQEMVELQAKSSLYLVSGLSARTAALKRVFSHHHHNREKVEHSYFLYFD